MNFAVFCTYSILKLNPHAKLIQPTKKRLNQTNKTTPLLQYLLLSYLLSTIIYL